MVFKVIEDEAGHPVVALAVLGRQHQHVAAHRHRVDHEHVERPPHPLRERGVAHGAHHERDVEVAAPHGHARELLVGARVEDDVVHEDEHPPPPPCPQQLLLLCEQLLDEAVVPLAEEEPGVPEDGEHVLQEGVARGAADEADDEIKLVLHPVDEVLLGG